MNHSPNPTAMSREAEAALTILEVSECGGFKSPKLPIGMAAVAVRWNLSGEETVEYVSESAVALLDAASRPRTALTPTAQTAASGAVEIAAQAKAYAIDLEQCSLFIDSPAARAMIDAAAFLRAQFSARPMVEQSAAGAVELREAVTKLVSDLDGLIADSEGVAGLHRNGDVATWDELTSGGRFEEWLSSLDVVRTALARPVAEEPGAPVEGEGDSKATTSDFDAAMRVMEDTVNNGCYTAFEPNERYADLNSALLRIIGLLGIAGPKLQEIERLAAPKANGVGTGGEGWQDRAEKAEAGLADAIAAIEFSEAIDDHYEARDFLKGWSEGDTSEWPEFTIAGNRSPAPPLTEEAGHGE